MGELRSGPLRRSLVREGVRLSCLDHPGDGAPVVLIHGLAGSAREWDETAARLGCSRRLLALDTRGHGASERRPVDLSRSAHVADVEACLEQLGLGPVVLAGQSLGGHTAFLVAARRPELVSGLVVLESTPDAIPGLPETIRTWLASWPVPFPTTSAAVEFFGGDTPAARGWVANLEQAADGLRPQFEIDVVVASTQEPAERSYWDEWALVEAPTLIVRGEHGLPRDATRRMAEVKANATVVEIPAAGHDAHLDNPAAWAEVLARFLAGRPGDR